LQSESGGRRHQSCRSEGGDHGRGIPEIHYVADHPIDARR
jgi:hypothetical protein